MLGLLGFVLASGLGAGGADDVLAARLEAAVRSGERDVAVRLRYELALDDEAAPVPLRILEMGGARVENLSVNGVTTELDRSAAPRLEASAPSAGGVLELAYDVRGAVSDGGVRLPVVSVGISQTEARPGTFRDNVSLPPEMAELALERFPPDDALPVVPAFVAFGAMPPASSAGAPVGFVFWGLFAVFGSIVLGYVVWMRWAERRGA